MELRRFRPRLAISVAAGALAIAGLIGVTPVAASPALTGAATETAGQVSPLCQLEGGQAFAVDTGQGRQFPYDPLVYPFVMAGDSLQVKVIPCWADDSPPSDNWITSVTAYLGDDNVPVAQANGLHTVAPFTLDLNGSDSIPATPSLAPLTIHATDNQGVTRWSAAIMVQLVTPCGNEELVGVDSGAAHDGYLPQIKGGAAQISVIPCSLDTSTPPDTWISSITAWVYGGAQVNAAHPAAELTGLHATDPFTLDLHNYDGTAFPPGPLDLALDVTDNHGVQQTVSRNIWVVDPISASWSVGTTQPDTSTTVQATFDNESGSPIRSVTFALDNAAGAGEPAPADLADDLSYAESTMTFVAGPNRIEALVTLANGITYPLAGYEVAARYTVDTSVTAPDNTEWGDLTTFRARAVSSSGTAQRGLTLHLQSRVVGSTTWVERAAATTDTHGAATLSVPAAKTGTAAWRVTSTSTKTQHPSTSPTHLVRVHAVFGRLPANRSIRIRNTIRYEVVIRPANARARVDIQVQRIGRLGWTTLGHVVSGPNTTTVPVRPTRTGNYRVRLVVEPTTVLARTISRNWDLRVNR